MSFLGIRTFRSFRSFRSFSQKTIKETNQQNMDDIVGNIFAGTVVSGAVAGAMCGAYTAKRERENSIIGYVCYTSVGGLIGGLCGLTFPITVPLACISLPVYLITKRR